MRRVLKRVLITLAALIVLGAVMILTSVVYIMTGCDAATPLSTALAEDTTAQHAKIKEIAPKYIRDEESTYLTFPEWYIVYSAEEYAAFLKEHRPSQFPYLSAIGQFWQSYACVYDITQEQYGFNAGRHLMIFVIGESFSVEYLLKGFYENTLGRLSEGVRTYQPVAEDQYAQAVAEEYGQFLHTIPWYEFPFGQKFIGLWRDTSLIGRHPLRKWERKMFLSVEYVSKAIYGWGIKQATRAVYTPAELEIYLWMKNIPPTVLAEEPRLKIIESVERDSQLIIMPRYAAFTDIVTKLARADVSLIEIAGNDDILLTALAPREWETPPATTTLLFSMDILTNPAQQRVALTVPVSSLPAVVQELERSGVTIEHFYDY